MKTKNVLVDTICVNKLQSNAPRIQSAYPSVGQTIGSYPPQQAQSGSMQYSPYPQRFPTPPAAISGTNHRPAYPSHQVITTKSSTLFSTIKSIQIFTNESNELQYPEQARGPWPPSATAAAQNAHGHSHQHQPPASPQHHVTSQSPVHAPSPSPQPPQPAHSPHQVKKIIAKKQIITSRVFPIEFNRIIRRNKNVKTKQ